MREPLTIPRIATTTGTRREGPSPAILYAQQSFVKWHLKRAQFSDLTRRNCITKLEQHTTNEELHNLHEHAQAGNIKKIIQLLNKGKKHEKITDLDT